MKFLKTLQKKQVEQPLDIDAIDNVVVSQNKIKERKDNKPPEGFNVSGAKIGRPNSSFNNQSDSLIETIPARAETETASKRVLSSFALKATDQEIIPPSFEQPDSFINLPSDESRLETQAAESENKTPLKSFALINIDSESVNQRIVAITQPNSSYCEEYRGLRTHILHKAQTQKLQSIVVASVGPSEGKSVTALNLSWLLAQTDGLKALIIDSDLRRPSLANYLAIETTVGLSDVLEGTSSLKEAIIQLEPAGLYLLPGGQSRHDVAELISGQKFKEILSNLRGMFDYVIIDAPPLGVFTDATVLINHADGALFVVCANKTRYKDVDRILEMLPRERLLGAILNQSDEPLISDNYYYDYYDKKNR